MRLRSIASSPVPSWSTPPAAGWSTVPRWPGRSRDGRLFAAGLDVYEHEPDVPGELIELENVVLAPHIGSATSRARDGMARLAAENVIAVLEGREPLTPV